MALKYRLHYIFIFFILMGIEVGGLPQLLINPQTFEANVYSGFPSEIQINFTNNGTQPFQNLTFSVATDSDFFKFPVLGIIQPNETVRSNITITSVGVFNRAYGIKTEFLYVDNESVLAKIHEVNITNIDFIPAYIMINRGDRVVWVNRDVSNHSVVLGTDMNSGVILPGGNWSYTFDNDGSFNYYDDIGGLTLAGNVNVSGYLQNQTKHDVALDVYMVASINSNYATGEMVVNELVNNLSLDPLSTGEGAIQIINNRNFSLLNINLAIMNESYNSWVVFGTQNFNVSAQSSRIITYTITPKVTKTIDTNRTHNVEYKLTSTNAPEENRYINVFVNYHDFGTINLNNTCVQLNDLSIDDTISFCLARPDYGNCQKLLLFCIEYPDYGRCKELYRERVVEVPVKYNISGEKIDTMIQSTELSGNVWQRMENKYTTIFEDLNSMKINYETMKSQYDTFLAEQQAIKDREAQTKKSNTISTVLKIVGTVFFCILFSLFMLFKYVVKKGFQYKLIRLPPD